MRSFVVAIAALALATTASAAGPGAPVGPFKLDGAGKCHAANGHFVAKTYCAAPAPKHCRDPKTGKYAKCGAPGAVPA